MKISHINIAVKVILFYTFIFFYQIHVSAQSGTIEITNIEYDCFVNNEKGMKIHSHINVNGWKDKSVNYAVFFYKGDNGTGGKLYAPNNLAKYKSVDGQVCAYSDSKSDYDNCEWKDWWVFLPYSALPHSAGQNNYSLYAEIRKGKEYNFTQFAATAYKNFNVKYDNASNAQVGSIEITNIEYDCYVDNEKGMKIHSHINVNGWKDKPVNYTVFFYKGSDGSGGKLYSTGKYTANDGHVCTYTNSKSDYDNCEWKDWWVFIPYSALPHSAGKNDYSLYATIRKNGDYDWEQFAKTSYMNFNVKFDNPSTSNTNNVSNNNVSTSNNQNTTLIDFVYSQYIVLNSDNETESVNYPKGDGWQEYIVSLEMSQNQVIIRLQTVDRMNSDKRTTLETHYIIPSNSYIDISSQMLRVTYKENGVFKGFTFAPEYNSFTFNDSWSSTGKCLKARHFAPPTDPMTIGMIQGFNKNENFKHTTAGEIDYKGKYNKLKTGLLKYNWSKKNVK